MAVDFTLSAKRRREEEERIETEREEEKREANRVPIALPKKLTAAEEADVMFSKLGDLGQITLFGNRIMVAKFIRTTIGTSGRLVAAKMTNDEDRWQGKIGLVIKKGTIAFQDDENTAWHGDDVNVGDWVFFQYGDGTDVDVVPADGTERVPCKILKEGEIGGKVARPDLFF